MSEFQCYRLLKQLLPKFKADAVIIFNHLGAQATYREETRSSELKCECVCVCGRGVASLIKWNMIQKTLCSLMTHNVPQERK